MSLSLTVNGVQLHQYAWNVVSRGSRWFMPERRGENISMPGVHGTRQTLGKPYDENTMTFSMWALGADPDGSVPENGDAARTCMANLDMLSRLFSAPSLDVRQTLEPTERFGEPTVRQCHAEVVQSVDFSSMAGGTRAEFAVELVVPSAFWFDLTETVQTELTGSGQVDTELVFDQFADATAPITHAVFEVTGPISSPVLADPVTGQWVKLGQTLTAGQVWRVDSQNWSTTVDGANALSTTSHGMGMTFLDLTADPLGPRIYVTGGSASAATSVQVSAKRAYFLA